MAQPSIAPVIFFDDDPAPNPPDRNQAADVNDDAAPDQGLWADTAPQNAEAQSGKCEVGLWADEEPKAAVEEKVPDVQLWADETPKAAAEEKVPDVQLWTDEAPKATKKETPSDAGLWADTERKAAAEEKSSDKWLWSAPEPKADSDGPGLWADSETKSLALDKTMKAAPPEDVSEPPVSRSLDDGFMMAQGSDDLPASLRPPRAPAEPSPSPPPPWQASESDSARPSLQNAAQTSPIPGVRSSAGRWMRVASVMLAVVFGLCFGVWVNAQTVKGPTRELGARIAETRSDQDKTRVQLDARSVELRETREAVKALSARVDAETAERKAEQARISRDVTNLHDHVKKSNANTEARVQRLREALVQIELYHSANIAHSPPAHAH